MVDFCINVIRTLAANITSPKRYLKDITYIAKDKITFSCMLLLDLLAYRLYREKPSSAGGYFLKSYTLLVLALHHEANVPLFEWARNCNLPFRRVFELTRRYKLIIRLNSPVGHTVANDDTPCLCRTV